MDGQPVEPHEPPNGRVLLGPAMRLDLMLDMVGDPGGRYAIRDSFYATNAYTLSEIVYGDAPPLRRDADKTPPVRFAPNTMPRSEEHTSELPSLMRISYAVFCLKTKNTTTHQNSKQHTDNYLNRRTKRW